MGKNLRDKLIIGSMVIAGLAGSVSSCKNVVLGELAKEVKSYQNQLEQEKLNGSYFTDKGIIAPLERYSNDDGIAMSVADMDNDGDLDILVAKSNSNNIGIRYIENLSDGRYADRGIIAPLERYSSEDGIAMSVADMDNDGDLDILVAKSNSNNTGIRYIENQLPQKNKGELK